jgi:segregation and condensation protein A
VIEQTPQDSLEQNSGTPVREPDPGQPPVTDPTPGLEPDPEPNPGPTPDDPDPEPDRDPHPNPPAGPDPDPDELPRTDPPAEPENPPVKTESANEPPPLVLTSKPVPPSPDRSAAKPVQKKEKKEDAEFSPFSVIVGQVYDGPMDLLLDLIRKQDIDIYDIPIARITAQFLAYVNQLKASDVDVAGEFIYMASLLIHIKSKMLLPRAPAGPEDAAEDPRRELVERLLEHERFKNAAQMLHEKQMLESASWTNPGIREFKDDVNAEPEIAADTTDLVRIFREILERARKRPMFNVQDDSVTVGQMIQFLGRRMTLEDKPIGLHKLLSHTRSERALVAMFLALLELVRLQAVLLRQDREFSEIFVKKSMGFDAVMNEGMSSMRDDWR